MISFFTSVIGYTWIIFLSMPEPAQHKLAAVAGAGDEVAPVEALGGEGAGVL
jgi:hypothetical protein